MTGGPPIFPADLHRRRFLMGFAAGAAGLAASNELTAWADTPPRPVNDTLSAQTARLVTVDAFGAVGDGITDDTESIDKAIEAMPYGGRLSFSGGRSYLTRGGHQMPVGALIDFGGALIRHTGDNTCFDFNRAGKFNLDHPTGVSAVRLIGNKGRSAAGFDVGNCWGWHIDGAINGYEAGVGVRFRNSTHWTEGIDVDGLIINDCAVGMQFTRTSGDYSFGYSRIRHLAINVPPGGIGIDIGGSSTQPVYLYSSDIEANIWPSGNDVTAVRISGQVNTDNLRVNIVGEVPSNGVYKNVVGLRNEGGTFRAYGRFHIKDAPNDLRSGLSRIVAGGAAVDNWTGTSDTTSFTSWLSANDDVSHDAIFGYVSAPDTSTPFISAYSGGDALRVYSTPYGGDLTKAALVHTVTAAGELGLGSGSSTLIGAGPGNPDGARGGGPGSLFLRSDAGPAATSTYVKVTGSDQTAGWVPLVCNAIRTVRENVALDPDDATIVCDGHAISITLPRPADGRVGREYRIKCTGESVRAVVAEGGLIDDQPVVMLQRWDVLRVVTDGNHWFNIS